MLWNKAAFLLLFGNMAFAALPPLAQSSREIQAILESPETYKLLGGVERIDQIVRCEKGYLVLTKHKELFIDICYLCTGKIGPAEFELKFHEPVEAD